jgi:peptidoglycan/LPS O-acetylase OafA/YrhL
LDGIRAIAVVATISVHLGHRWLDGVSVFFVLSGFLITGLLVSSGDRSLWQFWGRRMLRLYPALLLYLVGVAVFAALGWATVPMLAYVMGLLYLTNYVPFPLLSRETSHVWSLAVEEQFYLLWPVLLLWGRRLVFPVCSAAVGLSWWWRSFPPVDPSRYVERFFLPAADSVLIGCITALLVCPRPSHPVARALLRTHLSLVLGVCVVGVSTLVVPETPSRGDFVSATLLEAERVGVALVLLWLCGHQSARLVRLLELAPLRYLGVISYGVYLWQGLFVRNGPGDPQVFLHEWPWNVMATLVAAAFSYELVERRVLRLKERLRPASVGSQVRTGPVADDIRARPRGR